jgi:hypothetical protein
VGIPLNDLDIFELARFNRRWAIYSFWIEM